MWDHPRACGENPAEEQKHKRGEGSPPRMRGKHGDYMADKRSFGITPAHAGKTCHEIDEPILIGDHPRACGENALVSSCAHSVKGSPPRMRGKPNILL